MKVRCPNCQTLYRLEPAPEPVGDRRARCGRCDEVFPLAQHAVASPGPSARPADAEVVTPATAVAEVPPRPIEEPAAAPGPVSGATTAGGEGAIRFFGPQDPDQRARHLARALVSDIVAYYPDRLERSRAAGTLREEFREEVLKSWEEYVLQVGADFARDTDHFQTALNDILAEGAEIF